MNKQEKERLKRLSAEIVDLCDSGAKVGVRQKLNDVYELAKSISKPETEVQFRPDPEDKAVIANQRTKIGQLEEQIGGLRFKLAEAERPIRREDVVAAVTGLGDRLAQGLGDDVEISGENIKRLASNIQHIQDIFGALLYSAMGFGELLWRIENDRFYDITFPSDQIARRQERMAGELAKRLGELLAEELEQREKVVAVRST